MVGRLLCVSGTVVVIAVGLVTPVLATSTPPASADTVVDGCTIVSNPTPTNFTNCSFVNFVGADFGCLNLSYANDGSSVCLSVFPSPESAYLSSAYFSYANLAGALFVDCAHPGVCVSAGVQGANSDRRQSQFHAPG